MSEATDNRLDPCATLDRLDQMLASLAERITQRDQDTTDEATDTDNPNTLTTRSAARTAGQRQA